MQRLAIVVPYRDRLEHLRMFLPHIRAYFERDKADRAVPYSVTVVEQGDGLPFNRGALCNIGFILGEPESDYTCFHDVDYLPIWADYSWPAHPTCLLHYGAEDQEIVPGSGKGVRRVAPPFCGVVACANAHFRAVNGYSNRFWGWGSEDTDFQRRLTCHGLPIRNRPGTFTPLQHVHNGLDLNGELLPHAVVNSRRLKQIVDAGTTDFSGDGVSTVTFQVTRRKKIDLGQRPSRAEIVTVSLAGSSDL